MQIQEVGRIKTDEEYNSVIESLAREIDEYKSINETGANPKAEAEDRLRKEMAKLTGDMDKDEEKKILREIERLRAKIEYLKDGSYEAKVKQNITGFVLMKEEYEAQKGKIPFKDVLVGLMKGTPEVKEYLKKKYMLSLSNMYAVTPAPVSIDVEPIGAILSRMIKECNLVEIGAEDIIVPKEETALVPLEGAISGIREAIVSRIDTMVRECIEQTKEEKINYEHGVNKINLNLKKQQYIKRNDKDEKEQGEIEK